MGDFSWEKVSYTVNDTFSKSYAETKKKDYENLKRKLEKNQQTAAEWIAYLVELRQDANKLEENNEAAEGKIRTVFEDKTDITRENIEVLIEKIQLIYQEYQEQLNKVMDLYSYWSGEVEREDREMREKTQQEYEEGQ